MCSVLSATPNWLDSHQYLALWLEGIALLAIFIWDRIDASQQHKQTLAQLKVFQKQADTLVSSERSWVMVHIAQRQIGIQVTTGGDGRTTSGISIILNYTNAGRTPCWITQKRIQFALVERLPEEPVFDETAVVIDFLEPLVVGEELRLDLNLACSGEHFVVLSAEQTPLKSSGGNTPIVYGVFKYRDSFSTDRETRFGYTISGHGVLRRIQSAAYNNNV